MTTKDDRCNGVAQNGAIAVGHYKRLSVDKQALNATIMRITPVKRRQQFQAYPAR